MHSHTPEKGETLRLGALSAEEEAAIAAIADPVGIISAYMNFAKGGQHHAETEARRALASLQRSPPGEISGSEWSTLLDDALDRLVGLVGFRTEAGERGRAIFLPLSGDDGRVVRSAAALPDLVAIARQPYVRPLFAAKVASANVAVISVTHDGLTVTKFWGRQSLSEWSIPFDEERQGRRLQGPSHSRMHPGPRAEAQTDLLDRKGAAHIESSLAEAIDSLILLVRRHAWGAVVVGGDVRFSRWMVAALEDAGIRALAHPQHVSSSSERLAALGALENELSDDQSAKVRELLEKSETGGASLGPAATMQALEYERVGQVILGEPVVNTVTDTPPSPAVDMGTGGIDDPLNDVVLAALGRQVPVMTVSGDAARALPPAAIGCLFTPRD